MNDEIDSAADVQDSAEMLADIAAEDTGAQASPNTPVYRQMLLFVEALAKVATVSIFGIALLQYCSAQTDKQKERSLALVNEWVQNYYPDRILRVNAFVEERSNDSKKRLAKVPTAAIARARKNATNKIYADLVTPIDGASQAVRSDLDALFLFFSRTEICISSEICNRQVLKAYFESEAASLYQAFAPFIQGMRERGYKDYAKRGAEITEIEAENWWFLQ